MTSARARTASIHRIARNEFGYTDLRSGQEEAIKAVVDGHDTLVVMPTGSGKSAIYQVAAALLEGPAVIISPLIALQRDQVESIEAVGRSAAEVNSTVASEEREEAL